MKKWFMVVMLLASSANASPYLRLIGPNNYQTSVGALFNSRDINQTQVATAIGIFTHSTMDDPASMPSWLKALDQDWMFAVTGNYGGGNANGTIGPLVNITPTINQGILALLNQINSSKLANLKSFFQTINSQYPDVNVTIGPMLNLEVVQNGTIEPFNRWALDPLRYFAGASLKF